MSFSIDDIKAFVVRHYQYFIVGVLFICLVVVLAVFSKKAKGEAEAKEPVSTVEDGTGASNSIEVPDVPLEQDAYEGVNQLVSRYFNAMASGDTDTLSSICSELDEKEKIRIEKKAEYTENYSNFTCYTKPGPEPDSFIVFAYYEIKFKNIGTLAPGLTSLYVRTAPDGSLYVYDGELSAEVSDYIRQIAAQDDVVDLLHQVDEKYTEAAESDETLKKFMEALPQALDDAVSAELANREAAANQESAEAQQVSSTAKVKETINVRKSASKESDKLGQLAGGDTVTVVESLDNGWSQIEYQGQEAFVMTEYLEIEGATLEETASEGNAEETNTGDGNSKIGTVEINDTVNIRSGASTDSSKVASAYKGEKYDLYMDMADGWCKIDYKGQTAYVKSDFVKINKN